MRVHCTRVRCSEGTLYYIGVGVVRVHCTRGRFSEGTLY